MAIPDSTAITAAAAVGGSLVGGLASFATTFFTQRHHVHTERISKELDRREDIYIRFNELAAELMLEALDHNLDKPARLIGLITITGRIRLISSDEVLAAAEAVIAGILAAYERPAMDPAVVLRAPGDFVAPLVAFTRACRIEREALLRRM